MTMLRDEMSGRNDPYKKPIRGTDHYPSMSPKMLSEAYGYSPVYHMDTTPMMTGQEWYDRFIAEMHKQDAEDYHMRDVFKAAKRAAGLTDKETTE